MASYRYGYNDDPTHGDVWSETDAIASTQSAVRESDQGDWVGDPRIYRPAFEDMENPSITWGFCVELETAT